MPRDIVTVANLEPPGFLGYSAALDALVFSCFIGIPASDVGYQATLLLDRQGRIKRLSSGSSAYSGAADCDPRLSPSGRAVLTCSEVLRAGRPPLQLHKPHAQLRAARFLNDTTLLVLYEYGDYVQRRELQPGANGPELPVAGAAETAPMTADYEFVSTPAQRQLPTALILSTSGRVVRQFRLTTADELSSQLPRVWVKPAGTYVLLEDGRKLVLVPKVHPANIIELPLKQLPRFQPPRRPREKRYEINSGFSHLRLYIDTLKPQRIRYQILSAG